MIYTMVPRKMIFNSDAAYTKVQSKPDAKVEYESNRYQLMGYIDYLNSRELQKAGEKLDKNVTTDNNAKNKAVYEKLLKQKGSGWVLKNEPESKKFYATREIPVLERVFRFYKNLIQIDTPNAIHNSSDKKLETERGYHFVGSKEGGPALVGYGTKYRYQVWVDKSFPFIHQNVVKINLGQSYPQYSGRSVVSVIFGGQGEQKTEEVTFPDGSTRMDSADTHSAQYGSHPDPIAESKYGKGNHYYVTESNYQDPSMVRNSLTTGLVGVILCYIIAIPVGMLMSRFKNTWVDSLGMGLTTVLISMPSLAFIFIFRFLGSKVFNLPDLFPTFGAGDIRSYIMPAVILGILYVPSQVIWIRRFMIDQQSSDYVKFARAKGLSEREISRRHILKNAMIPIAQGIPMMIIMTIQGATMTETVFAFPGMGKMLPDAIKANNNAMVVGLTFIFTILAVFAVFAGDVVMTIIDPRIKLATKGGSK
jgi:oligopeptide transport system permease protein